MKKTIVLLIAIACAKYGCSTYQSHMIAEKDEDRILIGDVSDTDPLGAVVNYIFQNPSEYWPSHGNPIRRIHVVDETNRWTGFVGRDQLSAEIGDWNLDLAQLCQEYVNMRGKKYTIPNKFADDRVVVITRKELKQLRSNNEFYNQKEKYTDKIYVSFWPAVHFADYCLVRFHIGPTPHGATGTLLLKKLEGSWTIVRKQFSYYA